MERNTEWSPVFRARTAGFFYLLTIVTGSASLFLGGKLVVPGDAATTTDNILAHQGLYRLGFAVDLLSTVAYVGVTALFYHIFRPVNRSLSLLAAFLSLVGCTIGAFGCLFTLTPFVLLQGAPYLKVFSTEQLQSVTLMFLSLRGPAFNIASSFFGFYCLLIGYLVLRSIFLPKFVGILMTLTGLAWLTFLAPPLAASLSPFNMAIAILGEVVLTLWLLVAGVNPQQWNQQAKAAAASQDA